MAFAVASACTLQLLFYQAPGFDFLPLWTGAKVAFAEPGRLYDFAHITRLQDWAAPQDSVRPFAYPPSALLALVPFAAMPFWAAYALWVAATGALFAWAGVRFGAPWWFILLPSVGLIAFCGQVTYLVGGLMLAGFALQGRPVVSGLLLAAAAVVKPQLVLLLPFALAADRRWLTMAVTGLAGGGLVGLSALIWGVGAWIDWLGALPDFHRLIFSDARYAGHFISLYGLLRSAGVSGAWAYLAAPVACGLVWLVFRRSRHAADRWMALIGGTLIVSHYVMSYELALFAPAVAVYLARTEDRRWPAYLVAGVVSAAWVPWLCLSAIAVLPVLRLAGRRAPLVDA